LNRPSLFEESIPGSVSLGQLSLMLGHLGAIVVSMPDSIPAHNLKFTLLCLCIIWSLPLSTIGCPWQSRLIIKFTILATMVVDRFHSSLFD